jgi:hypothetical protein
MPAQSFADGHATPRSSRVSTAVLGRQRGASKTSPVPEALSALDDGLRGA